MAFPTSIDNLSNTRASAGADKLSSPNHLTHHVAEDAAVEALENKVGIDSSAVVSSIDYLLKNANSINPGHKHNVLSALDGSPAQAVYVDGAGNVGIGTTSPSSKLHVFSPDAADSWNSVQPLVEITNLDQSSPDADALLVRGGALSNLSNIFEVQDYSGNTEFVVLGDGNVGIGITDPSAKLDINSDIVRLRTAKTPASAGAAGNQGDICWDAHYIYVCVATNTWQRALTVTW